MSGDAGWLDGNALGGLLQETFGADLTGAPHVCQAGAVLRCPVCEQIALVATTLPDRHVLHLNGTWRLEMPRS
jgi:hypothetical protein